MNPHGARTAVVNQLPEPVRQNAQLARRVFGHWRDKDRRERDLTVARGMKGTLPPVRPRRRDQVWAVSVVLNEVDIIESTVRHHLDQGCDHILIADNMSTDGTFELLRDLSRTLPVTVLSDTTKPFYQGAKVTWLSRVAWLSGARWIIPFDADERWFAPGESLREFFTRNTQPHRRCDPPQFLSHR